MKVLPEHFAPVASNLIEDFPSSIEKFDLRLTEILRKELESGSKISGVTTDWPQKSSVVISLERALAKDHERPHGIYFEMPNDPKSWCYQYSNYINDIITHMLISGKSA